MARTITEAFTGTENVGSTEWSCTTDTAGPDVETTAGQYQFFLDISDMVTGDELQIKVYEKVRSGDTQRLVYQSNLVGPQSPPIYVSPVLFLKNGWDVTLKAISGTITVNWSLRTPDTDPDVAAIKTKTDQLTFTVANQVDVNVVDWKGAAAPAMTGDAYARLGAPVGASIAADIAGVQADTDNIQTRLPAALVSGRMDASVGAMANDVVTAAAIAADAIGSSELAASAVTEIQSGLSTLDAAGVRAAVGMASANLDTQIDALPTTAEVNAEVDTALSDAGVTTVRMAHLDADVSSRLASGSYTAPPSAATIAQAVWDALTSALTTVGSIGKLLVTNVDAAISTRLASGSYTAPDNAGIAAIKAKTDNLPSDPADQSLIIAATDQIRTDIAGLNDLSAAEVNAEVDTALADAGVTGVRMAHLDADVSSRLATAGYTAPDNASVTAVKAKTDSLTFTVAGKVDANVTHVNETAVAGSGTGGDPWGPA